MFSYRVTYANNKHKVISANSPKEAYNRAMKYGLVVFIKLAR